LDQFKRNLRSANDGKDFKEEYLEEIYRAIKIREIIMPDEHDNDESFEYAWKGLLMKFGHSGDLSLDKSKLYDKYLFENSWLPIITTLSFVFATATDDTVVARIITGFIQAANIAERHSIHGVIDRIIENLSIISTLSSGDLSVPSTNLEIQIEGDGSITVSDLSVPFGSDFKAQMATVTLFRIARACTGMIGQRGWNLIFPTMANLYLYDLIKPSSLFAKSTLSTSTLPLTKPQYIFKRSRAGRDVGLFSTISSYLAGYNDGPQEPSDEEVDATYSAIDCVNSCEIGEFFTSISNLDDKNFVDVVDILISKVPKLIGNSDSVIETFSPTALYFLEMAVRLAMRDSASVEMVGAKVQAALYVYIMKSDGLPDYFLSKIIFYILSLLKQANDEFVEDLDMILKSISQLDENFLRSSGPILLTTLLDLADGGWSEKHSICSPHYFYILSILAQNRQCSQEIYKFLTDIVRRAGSYINHDNIKGLIDILGQIASVNLEETKKLPPKERDIEVKKSQKALDTMFALGNLISERANFQGENSTFLDYIDGISKQCANPNTTVRSHAIGYLQRIMLAPDLKFEKDQTWLDIFDRVLFPLIQKLLKPEIYELDPKGMAVTRLQCATLLCKVFLAFIVNTKYDKLILKLWVQLLETLDRLLNSGQRDSLNESVVEALKNVLLVLGSSEFGADAEFWEQTWKHIDSFLPGLREELFPEAKNEGKDGEGTEGSEIVEGNNEDKKS
jgi:brefeldin A-resistance guanine nucleotide exchange factor 1